MYSAQYGHPAVSKLLLDSGADIRMKDADGNTVLALAKLKGNADIVQSLKNVGKTDGSEKIREQILGIGHFYLTM